MSQPELHMGEAAEVVKNVANRYGVESLQIRNTVNYVGIGDERLVIKAPQSTQSMGGLAVEAAALELLERSPPLSAAIPQLVEFSTDPAFLVTKYLPGKIIEAATLQEISFKDRETLGHDIGAYVLSEAQINLEAARHEIPPLEANDTWGRLFETWVGNFSSPAFPSTSELAKKLYARWLQYHADTTNEQFIQGDLRLGNMAVSSNNRLHGVFDFGRAGVGTINNEISPLINLDSTIMQGVINELQAASVDIDIEQLHVWDEMKKLAQLTHYISGNDYRDNPPTFVSRACRIVSAHHPELEWSEFNTLNV
ncbi:MAG TPA: aminoglycoside phosphotransferase family protein [Candidatus Saccharimonadales bacterium]